MKSNILRKVSLILFMGITVFSMNVFASSYGNVNEEAIELVSCPSKGSISLQGLYKGQEVILGDKIGEFIRIDVPDGFVGYIETKYINRHAPIIKKVDKGQEVVKFASKHVGNPYRYGGNSLTNGTDCSGFTSSVYKNFGVNINRTSGGQLSNGKSVAQSNLKAGDLVFFGYNGRPNHVAIYMGNNKIVHAGTSRTGIHVSPLHQRGMSPYIGARRVL